MNTYRTHTCGELRKEHIGQKVKLAGWIQRKRNLGNLCFVDLRDHYGITQCVFDSSSDLFAKIEEIRPESVIGIDGEVILRESINKNMPTGDIEIKVTGLRPGEKLYEERLMEEEGLTQTENKMISIGKPLEIDEKNLFSKLKQLEKEAVAETDKMKELVHELVPTYKIDNRS